MLSSVRSTLAAAVELPPPPETSTPAARSAAARAAGEHLAAAAAVLASVAAGAPAAAKAARKAASPRAAPSAEGYAAAATKPASRKPGASAAKAGPLDFLDDRRLSVEEKLLKLLAHLNDKWNKDLDAKMKELRTKGAKEGEGASGSSRSGGASGLFQKAVGLAKTVFPAAGVTLEVLRSPAARSILSSFAGPALAAVATSAGFPQLAPVALRYGPQLVDAAAGLATSIDRGEVGAGGGAGGGAAKPDSADPIGSDRDDQVKLMEIQRIMDQQKEMFSLVSNLLRTGHETRMAVIQNVR